MNIHLSHSLEETKAIAKQWLTDLSKKYSKNDEAVVVGLSGHLGAGKTAFVKSIAKEFGIQEEITSPTFVIMKIYEINTPAPWKKLVHIDAYRLEKPEEMEALRFEDVVKDKDNLVMVEWPEQVQLEKIKEDERIHFEMTDGICTITFGEIG